MHLWLGLVFGLPIALVSLAGLPITYWSTTDRMTTPTFYPPAPKGALGHSLDDAVLTAALAIPDAAASSLYIIETGSAAHVMLDLPHGEKREVAVSLHDGKMLGLRDPERAAVIRLYDFHTRLWSGERGEMLVLFLAFILMVSTLTGVILWWPRRGKIGTALQPQLRRGRRLRDLHLLIGLYTLLPILAAAATTIGLAWPEDKAAPLPEGRQTAVTASPPAVLDIIKDRLRENEQPLRLRSVRSFSDSNAILTGVADTDGELWSFEADRETGDIEALERLQTTSSDATLRQIHTGAFAGSTGQTVMALSSVVPMLLLITGLIWWLRTSRF